MAALAKGASGSKVKELQELLNKAGAKPKLKTDSKFGPGTETALKTFQKKNGLKADGKADPKTMTALKSAGGAGGGAMEWPVKADFEQLYDAYHDIRADNNKMAIDLVNGAAAMKTRLEKAQASIADSIKKVEKLNAELESTFPQFKKTYFDYHSDKNAFEKVREVDPAKAKALATKGDAKAKTLAKQLDKLDDLRVELHGAADVYRDVVKPLERA